VAVTDPTTAVEQALAAQVRIARGTTDPVVVVGVDEVGRGALAGPVAVGACAVLVAADGTLTPLPPGIRDSKSLTALRRTRLAPQITEAAAASAIGWAEAAEIDGIGIVPALELAATRALQTLRIRIDAVIMDGVADVVTPALHGLLDPLPLVHVQPKADRDCVSVAAASVVAKVARDELMVGLDAQSPHYGWAGNKGYGSAAHRQAIAEHGAHTQHRHTWNLTGGVLWEPGTKEATR
jgi:ribonuclease HII